MKAVIHHQRAAHPRSPKSKQVNSVDEEVIKKSMLEVRACVLEPSGWEPNMANNGSYANETTGEATEYANDLAVSGSFFSSDYKRHEDLKTMLDSNKDGLKLEAMKRIIGMVAKGKDASDLFPAVVKNVVSKNIEVKKLVYVYLVRYAEEQQDLALLSISTFQRALKDPNQLIRASALRVLSSIRVPVIIPIVMLAIKDAVNDMSPYVRKTVAHAIPKLYSLDPEQKDQLIEVIEKLLADKTTLVVGSAVMAFEEVCPERIDLIHKNYRKLCNLLVDVEEWGQVVIMKMLTHYARTQFIDPNRDDVGNDLEERPFYEDEEKEIPTGDKQKPAFTMDNDHRLLLRISKPLLQSRNTSVVMAVAQLYHHLAPRSEVNIVAKSLIRLLRNHREVQSVVLSNIATMSTKRRGMFEPYLKSFFIRSSDPTHIKILKLEILTNLATDANISIILREFQTYVSSTDKEFVAATIQAIGRCASNIKEVTDTCLNGLVSLMSNRSEAVVAESVVVIKKLLQMQPSEHKDIIVHTSRLVDNITVPMARASILWLLGEYSDLVPKIAPDVLRKMAKTFIHEEDIVKLQVLNLATKLYLTNPKQTKLLSQYIFNLAKYDQNYDIRDRSRFLRQLIFSSGDHENVLAKHCKKIFLSTKPAPLLESKFKDRDQYQLGSLSHFMNMRASGYHDLPEFPQVAPDPSVRNVEVTITWTEPKKKKQQVKMKSFYSDTDSSSRDATSDSDASDDSDSEAGSSGSGNSGDGTGNSDSSSGDDSDASEKKAKHSKNAKQEKKRKPEKKDKKSVSTDASGTSSDSSSDSSSSDSSSDESSSEESSDDQKSKNKSSDEEEASVDKKPKKDSNAAVSKKVHNSKPAQKSSRNAIDLLLDLNEIATPATPGSTAYPSISGVGSGILTPTLSSGVQTFSDKTVVTSSTIQPVYTAMYVPVKYEELFNKVVGGGVSAEYRFTRSQNAYSAKMISVELVFTNHSDKPVTGIKVGKKNLAVGMELYAFPEIESLAVGSTMSVTVGIDFNQTTQPATFEIVVENKNANVSIKAPIGELIQAVSLGEHEFVSQQNKLKGLNENTIICDVSKSCLDKGIASRVYEVANMMQILSASNDQHLFRFAAQSMSTNSLVLLSIKVLDNGKASVTINCEKIVISSMLLKEVKQALGK